MKELTLTDGVWGKKYNHTFVKYACVVLTANLIGIAYYVHSFIELGYLPSPFIYDKSDTFMDFFNVLYWAYDSGRYTDWGSIYPPLSFFIVKFINFVAGGASSGEPATMRVSSPIVLAAISIIYLAIPFGVIKMRMWRVFDATQKMIMYLILITSVPMLFTLERGNVIIIIPLFLALMLEKIGWLRVICIAILINIKPYFALLLFYYVARNNLIGLARAVLVSAFVFFATGLALDSNFMHFFGNIFSFAQMQDIFSLREIMAMPSSISAFSATLKHPDASILALRYFSEEFISGVIVLIEVTKWSVIALAFIICCVKSNKLRDAEIFCIILVAITNLGVWVGGYSVIFYLVLIPVVFKLKYRIVYISLLALMSIPLDSIPVINEYIGSQYSYVSDVNVGVQWTLGFGAVLRPILNFSFLLALTMGFLMADRTSMLRNAFGKINLKVS